ncbi:MAG: M20/M25/M40 family metallo-hydrolase [Bacillota bacterium]
MRRATLIACAVILLILAALAAKSVLIAPPPVHDGPGEFDATRAKARLAYVLGDQQPHPADSAADDAVRGRILTALGEMGLKPIVRDQVTCNDFQKARLVACTRVRNVIATLGPANGKALLLSAHYDSVPVGPGASDDGVGVATLLEVASILKDRPLKRPVILLFNEGEELGLVGARAFLADPLSSRVDSLLNFEARGVTGPVTMFETSQPNGPPIAAFATAVRRPFASSMMTDVARLIPNDTDVTTYKERGWLTLNFAMTGNETRYHSPGDDLAGLDARSLQHMGDQALAVSSELASGRPRAGGRRIFMDVAGRWFVQMPLVAGIAAGAVLLLAFAFLVWRRRAYRALATAALALVGGAVAGWLGTVVMGALRAGTYWRANPEISFLAIYATALVAVVAIFVTMGRRLASEQLRAAFWLLFLLLGAGLAAVAPGAIIFFLIPPALLLAGVVAGRRYQPAEQIGAIAGLLFLLVTWGETLALTEELFSPGPLWIAAPVATLLMIAVLVEAQPVLRDAQRRPVIAFTALVALVGSAAAAAAPAYSPTHQQRFTIEHVTEFPSRKTYWSVLNDGAALPAAYSRIGKWTHGKLPFSDRERWFAAAPPAPDIKAPAVQPLEVLQNGGERRITLRLHANGFDRIQLIAPADAHIRTAGVQGFIRPIGGDESASGRFTIFCNGRSCDGMQLIIDAASPKPIAVTLVGSRNGLPAIAAPLVQSRPANARPQYVPDETMAVTHVKL